MDRLCIECGTSAIVSRYGRKCPKCLTRTEQRRRERAKKRPVRAAVRSYVIARDGSTCRYCCRVLSDHFVPGRRFDYNPDRVEVDHIVPVRHGGYSVAENLVVSCTKCNRIKGAHDRCRLAVLRSYIAVDQSACVRSIYEDLIA